MRRIVQWTVFLLGVVLVGAVHASMTHAYRLNNGLLLVVREDHRAPVVVQQVWYRVGASDEHWGITGISHLLEHMMFKGGTTRHPAGEFAQLVAGVGGQLNAFTSDDVTCYWEEVSPQYLRLVMGLEADRMQHLQFDPKAFEKELKVVQEERSLRIDDRPSGVLYERFAAIANAPGPYAHNPAGWANNLKHLTLAQTHDWYHQWYMPNNAIVVVVGDVQPEKVHQMAVQLLGQIPARTLPVQRPYRGVGAWGMRRIDVHSQARLPMVMMGYGVPVLNTAHPTWAPWALMLLSQALDDGHGHGRLNKALVRQQAVASSVHAGYDLTQRGDTQWQLMATPMPGHDADVLVAALRDQVRSLRTRPVGKAELHRLKQQASANHIFAQDSLTEQATQLGGLAAVGLPYTLADAWLTHVKPLTEAQLQEAASRWLVTDALTVAVARVLPKGHAHATERVHALQKNDASRSTQPQEASQ